MKKLLTFFSLILLSACGFSPLYGVHGGLDYGNEDLLAYVAIENIPNREGQYVRNALIDRFYRTGRPDNPAYSLHITNLEETISDLDITKTSDATRAQLRVTADLILKDATTGETLLQRNLRSISSYNILSSEFATRISEDNTRLNALDDLARQIELQINLYLSRQKSLTSDL